MKKFDRVAAILIHLQSKPIVTAQELSERFEVSLRTIYRDIEALTNAGAPIIGEVGVGYSMMEGYRLPPLMFTQEEVIAFLMAEKIVGKYLDEKNIRCFQSALFKVKSVLRRTEKLIGKDLEERIAVVRNAGRSLIIDQNLPLIIKSLTCKEILQITYAELDLNTIKTHSVEPIGVVNENGRWNVLAYSNEIKAYRRFWMDRISRIKLTGKPFEKLHVNLTAHAEGEKKTETFYNPIISVKMEVAHFIEEQKYRYGFVDEKEVDGKIEMEFQTACLQSFCRWFLSIADNAKIVKPIELKTVFRQVVNQISENI